VWPGLECDRQPLVAAKIGQRQFANAHGRTNVGA
jgi:hypothetical protein